MITTVTLNAAIDKTYFISSFQENGLNRTDSMYAEPGGKGINVAKVLHTLDAPVTASGIVGGYNGKRIISMLDDIGLHHEFIQVDGESRLCLNIIDQKTGGQTEINESGPVINETDWQTVKRKIKQLAEQSKYMIFSGSLSKGLDDHIYAELIQSLKDTPTKIILDTSGPALQRGLQARPHMIKPNKDELAGILDQDDISEHEIIETLKKWQNLKIPIIIVSLGSEGAIVSVEGRLYKVEVPKMTAVNPVGSGDAFIAGMVKGLCEGLSIEETLRLAAAAGTANACENQAGTVNSEQLEFYKAKVKVTPLSRRV